MTGHVYEAIVHFRQVRREDERLLTADSWSRVCLLARNSRDSFAALSSFATPHHKHLESKQLHFFDLTLDTPTPSSKGQAQPCIARQQGAFASQQAPVNTKSL